MSDHRILDITPLDPDIVEITDWLAGELTEAEKARVEQRLRDDDAFWMKAGPIVKLWRLPVNYEALYARYAAAPKAKVVAQAKPVSEWARATAAAIVRGVGAEPLPEPLTIVEPSPAPAPIPVTKPAPLPRGERIFRFWFGWAGDTKPAGPGHYWARMKYAYGTMLLGAFGYDRRVNAPESPAEKDPVLQSMWTWVERGVMVTAVAATLLLAVLGTYSSYQNADDSALIRRSVHVFTRPALTGASKLETSPAQEVATTLPSGTRTIVRASSRLQWNVAGVVLLRGTATFEVPPDVREQRVLTDYGDVRMGPGRYALGRSGDGKLVLISVAAGLARIRSDTAAATDSATVIIGTGEFGTLESGGFAAKVAPHTAREHPSFTRERVVFRSSGTPGNVERWRQFSWIHVTPGSRMTWTVGNPAVVHLTGEMAMVLDPRDGMTRVQTDAGDVVLDPGSHALKTVIEAGYSPLILVSARGEPPRTVPRVSRVRTPTEAIVEWLGFESGRVRARTLTASDFPSLIPDSLAPRTPFGAARGVRP